MSKPDWSKAPEGATHWGPFYANAPFGGKQFCVGWIVNPVDDDLKGQLIPRPIKPRYTAHYGGPCPVAGNTFVDVVFPDGTVFKNKKAKWWGSVSCDNWRHDEDIDRDDMIIAYRVITDGE